MLLLLVAVAATAFVLPPATRLTTPTRGTLVEREVEIHQVMNDARSIVLISGFEAFNVDLYERCAESAASVRPGLDVEVFSDRDISRRRDEVEAALGRADAVIVSLLFDYDDVEWLVPRVDAVETRLVFESATELMELNRVGTFSMAGGNGPPAAVKFFTEKLGKKEDKFKSYMEMLKVGPSMLKYLPGDKARDLKSWLELYGLWNEGGETNVQSMLGLLDDRCLLGDDEVQAPAIKRFPAIGLTHPDMPPDEYFSSPTEYLEWYREQRQTDDERPELVIAVLLYRKHVATKQPYINAMIRRMEQATEANVVPLPIFIAGVEAHTVVRDWLLNLNEVDAIVNTIGFPLVGGPAGSMKAGRDVALAEQLLKEMDAPYVVAGPLLLQDVDDWRSRGVSGLQSLVLYALPELDGATDPVVLGGLTEGGKLIALDEERVDRLVGRVAKKIHLARTPNKEKKVAAVLYGYPPNVGAVGTAALFDVPASLDTFMTKLKKEGYDLGKDGPAVSGAAIVAALSMLTDQAKIPSQTTMDGLENQILKAAKRAKAGDSRVAEALREFLADDGESLKKGVSIVRDVVDRDNLNIPNRDLKIAMDEAWPPRTASSLALCTRGLRLGNFFVGVQPLLGYEGDPMGILFGKAKGGPRLTPHPDYVAFYDFLKRQADAVVHFGTHGTVEWLPGQPLGNDRNSWPDILLGNLPHLYLYTANNPSEAILAKRRGLATIVSYLSPPYARSGLYLQLTTLKEDLDELLQRPLTDADLEPIIEQASKCGLLSDVPLLDDKQKWAVKLSMYLVEVKSRLFSNGLRVLGSEPSSDELAAYLDAYLDDPNKEKDETETTTTTTKALASDVAREEEDDDVLKKMWESMTEDAVLLETKKEARAIKKLLQASTEELTNLVDHGLAGGYVPPAPGGDLLRDGAGVLPTGRNIHALDPYRMPSTTAWRRGQVLAEEILTKHVEANGAYPETVAVALWGLDAIKTRGESVAVAVALAGGQPVREATGRVVRFEPVPNLGRPRVDVLCTLSGIFRDSFENVVLLLDDFFERCAKLPDEENENFIKKHAKGSADGEVARLFSNPAGDYGSLVNDRVVGSDWEDASDLGDQWAARNSVAFGRNKQQGKANAEGLDKLLETTDLVVQEVDSVEYGLTDIQEYYANTGALKKAAEKRRPGKKKVAVTVVEAFGSKDNSKGVRDLDETLRLEYRAKLLNPKWADSMAAQGSGGVYEISSRMTAALGWAATSGVDDFVFDQAAERYALDKEMAAKLQAANPEAFKNVVARLLETHNRGLWTPSDPDMIHKLQDLYDDADDIIEGVAVISGS